MLQEASVQLYFSQKRLSQIVHKLLNDTVSRIEAMHLMNVCQVVHLIAFLGSAATGEGGQVTWNGCETAGRR